MRIAAVQMNIAWEDRQRNYDAVSLLASKAKENSADLLVLPEMFSTGFSLDPSVTAEPEDGPTVRFLKHLAKTKQMNIIGGVVFGKSEERAKNSALVIDRNGREVSRYTKMKLFSYAGETKSHQAGTSPVTFTLEGITCACFICYDLRFPSLFCAVADQCDALFVIASWPEARQRHWNILLPARAVENQLYVIGVNRVGEGGRLTYTGGSRIIDPMGNDIACAQSEPTIIYGNIDPAVVQHIRTELPFLKDSSQ
jgi:predicted amidohydrolase